MESFEHIGYWWLPKEPEEPDQYLSGTLFFDPETGGKLTLIAKSPLPNGLGSNPKLGDKYPVVLGQMDGVAVTLRDCTVGGPMRRNRGDVFATETFTIYAETILKGFHFANDVLFEQMSVIYSQLGEWMNLDLYSRGDNQEVVPVTYDPVRVDLDKGLKLILYCLPDNKWGHREVSLQQVARMTLIPEKPMQFIKSNDVSDNLYDYIDIHLRNFMTFVTGNNNIPIDVTGIIRDGDIHREVEVYYRISGAKPVFLEFRLTFKYTEFINAFPVLLRNWVESSQRLRHVYDLFFKRYYQTGMDASLQFIHLAQALEAYHRDSGKFKCRYMPGNLYKKEIKQLLKSIPKPIKGESRLRMKGEIRRANEFTLKTRILYLCGHTAASENGSVKSKTSELLNLFAEMVESPELFAEHVKETRNDLTHRPDELSSKHIPEEKMPLYLLKMRLLLRIHFLLEMELSTSQIEYLWQMYPW